MVDFEKEGEASGTINVSDYEKGVPECGAVTGSTLDDGMLHVFTVNGDGTAEYAAYAPAVK